VDTGGGEVTANADADALWSNGHVVNLFLVSGCRRVQAVLGWSPPGSLRGVIDCA
jgi:hypothetical protein